MSIFVCRFAADIYTLLGFTAASLFHFAANRLPLRQRTFVAIRQRVYYKYTHYAKNFQTRAIHPPRKRRGLLAR